MNTKIPPNNWGNDKLSNFIETAYQNSFSTFDNRKSEYNTLRRIDDCFYKITTNLTNPKCSIVPPLLLLRCHSVYRATCSLVMNGQVIEGFVLMRSCLENASYALHIFKSENNLDEVWLKRHDDKKSISKTRNEFGYQKVLRTIAINDKKLSDVYDDLYNKTLDFGAHPNERAITSSLKIKTTENNKIFEQDYLAGNDQLTYGLKSLAQVGLCSLYLFQNIFSERFSILGLREELQELRKIL
jgi:hypothetical protein